MKKPKLNKVDPSVIYDACNELEGLSFSGAMLDYREKAQNLINRFIPEGWRLDLDDTDSDVFEARTDNINRTFNAIDELNSCYVSCNSLKVTEAIKRIVVRSFTNWLNENFKEYGEEVK